jgi:deoxycytidine triphosphate deaminase
VFSAKLGLGLGFFPFSWQYLKYQLSRKKSMLLSDQEVERRIVPPADFDIFKTHWENGRWSDIGDRILLMPYAAHLLNTCTYDLTVGNQYASLRYGEEIRVLQPTDSVRIDPGETVIILTDEYVALPKTVAALVVPRARQIFRGMLINATRIDPSWYGKLAVGVTNLSKEQINTSPGESFCSCIFMETHPVRNALTKATTPSLGRTNLQKSELPSTSGQKLKAATEITRNDLDATCDTFGKPWDVMRGAFELTKNEIIDYIDNEKGPDIIEDATTAAIKRAFNSQKNMLYIVLGGVVFPVVLAVTLYLLELAGVLPKVLH